MDFYNTLLAKSLAGNDGGGDIPSVPIIEIRESVCYNYDDDTETEGEPEIISDTKLADIENAVNKGIWPIIKYYKEVEEIEDGESNKYTADEQDLRLNQHWSWNRNFDFIGVQSASYPKTFRYSFIRLAGDEGENAGLHINGYDISGENDYVNNLWHKPTIFLDTSNMTYIEDVDSVPIYEVTDDYTWNFIKECMGLDQYDDVLINIQNICYTPVFTTTINYQKGGTGMIRTVIVYAYIDDQGDLNKIGVFVDYDRNSGE